MAFVRVWSLHTYKTYDVNFIYENLMVQANVTTVSFRRSLKRPLHLGSSYIYQGYWRIKFEISRLDLATIKLNNTTKLIDLPSNAKLGLKQVLQKAYENFKKNTCAAFLDS